MKDELNRMESKHLMFLKRQEEEIKRSISKITESIVDLHNYLPPMISTLSMNTNPGILNSEICLLNPL